MSWQITFHPKFKKQLKRLPKEDVQRIYATLKSLRLDPFAGDIKNMVGEKNVWRRRIGSYRIFYELFPDRRIVFVYKVERRTTTTYR